jgi:phosphohistidine phosphatase SixA
MCPACKKPDQLTSQLSHSLSHFSITLLSHVFCPYFYLLNARLNNPTNYIMKNQFIPIFTMLMLMLGACTKNDNPDLPTPGEAPVVTITNEEFKGDLLFVNKNNFQLKTSEPATFLAANQSVSVNSSGMIERITSGEVAAIDVTSIATGKKTTIYAMGATDDNHVNPFMNYHAAPSDDPYGQYLLGWETLKKLPISGETHAIVLRHADADTGEDYTVTHPNDKEPANWWKSSDPALARQLNDAGKIRAAELGVIFKDLQLPVKKVVASEFYRAIRTAELMNLGPQIAVDERLNHNSHNSLKSRLFTGLQGVIKDRAVDGEMMLISTHHPINEFNIGGVVVPSFPMVSAFNWTAAYIVKINSDKTITYQGAVSFGMFKYWRDLKLKK